MNKKKEGCWKDKFKSEKKARIAANRRGKKLGMYFHVYKCDICKNTWHLTRHSKKSYKDFYDRSKERKRWDHT